MQTLPDVTALESMKASLAASSSESGELLKKIAEAESIIKDKDKQCIQLKEALQEQVLKSHDFCCVDI